MHQIAVRLSLRRPEPQRQKFVEGHLSCEGRPVKRPETEVRRECEPPILLQIIKFLCDYQAFAVRPAKYSLPLDATT